MANRNNNSFYDHTGELRTQRARDLSPYNADDPPSPMQPVTQDRPISPALSVPHSPYLKTCPYTGSLPPINNKKKDNSMSTWIPNTDDNKTSLKKHNAVRIRKGSYLAQYGLAPGGRRYPPGHVITARFVRVTQNRDRRRCSTKVLLSAPIRA
jgi:hypothetical protein